MNWKMVKARSLSKQGGGKLCDSQRFCIFLSLIQGKEIDCTFKVKYDYSSVLAAQYPEQGFIKSQNPWMGPFRGERALLGGPDYGFRKILANGAGQEKLK